MLTYSIAIRTLGTSGEVFREELLSIACQTIQPERVLIYIAEGYSRPEYTIGREEYVWVKKGMVAQRILPYNEITSDVIFMLDDDVRLAPDSAERMLKAMEEYQADCVGVDTFKNHKMSMAKKIYAALTNLVFPHRSDKWAFKIHHNGSFSYNNYPTKNFYWSQSCAGNAMLWKKSTYKRLHFEDELWLDDFSFAYNDDMLESYKVYKNGFKLGIVYNSDIVHLDMKSASRNFRESSDWLRTRTGVNFLIWMRACYKPGNTTKAEQVFAIFSFSVKTIWLFMVMTVISVLRFSFGYILSYLRGLKDGWKYIHLCKYKELPPYFINKNVIL